MATQVVVTLDGTVHDGREPLLHADDLSVVRGDGVFETVLVRDGKAVLLDKHLDRLVISAGMLELPETARSAWESAIETAVARWVSTAPKPVPPAHADAMMRLVYTRGREGGGPPTCFVSLAEVPDRVDRVRSEGVSVVTLGRGYSLDFAADSPWQLYGAKTLSYATNMAALRYARTRDADDAIFLSSERFVLEGPRSTVIVVNGDELHTPPVDTGILRGTTQAALFEIAPKKGFRCFETPLRPADLLTADAVWLVSSITLAAHVRELDGVPLRIRRRGEEIPSLIDIAIAPAGAGPMGPMYGLRNFAPRSQPRDRGRRRR